MTTAKATKKTRKMSTAIALDKHRKIVRELPLHLETRMQNIAARDEILRSTEAYNARLERDRVTAHLHNMPPGLQRLAAQHHIGQLDAKIHHLANKGVTK